MSKKAETKYPVIDLIRARWSPRVFSDKEVSDDTLMTLFEAAQWAASSMNEQPWRFMYFRRGTESYERVFNCLARFNRQWVKNAPVLVVTIYKKQFASGKENFHAMHDLGLAVGNLSLQAQEMGISVHQMAGVDWKKVHAEFNIPEENYHVTTAIAIGYYGGDPNDLPEDLEQTEREPRTRKKLEDIVFNGAWRND